VLCFLEGNDGLEKGGHVKIKGRRSSTEEVDDEAAVGAAAGGAAEEGLAVGRLGERQAGGRAVHAEVAGVGHGVAEAEDGVELLARHGQEARGHGEERDDEPGRHCRCVGECSELCDRSAGEEARRAPLLI
jgi:hypothetical protein